MSVRRYAEQADPKDLALVRHYADMYLAGHPVDDPLVSPLYADLHGLPKTLIQNCTADPIALDSKAIAERLRDHGVDVRLDLYPGTHTCSRCSGRSCPRRPTRSAGPVSSPPRSAWRSRIPGWYHFGMSKQIAVRLPDDVVEFIDGVVRSGDASSRAAVVARALERERRRLVAARDVEILKRSRPDRELDRLAEHASQTPLDDLD